MDSIVSDLLDFGARYRAYLHQDEFGPTRAERTAALRTLLHDLDAVISHLEHVPGDLRSKLSRDLAQEIEKPPLALIDTWVLGRLYELSIDNGLAKLGEAALKALLRFGALDSTTAGEIAIATLGRKYLAARRQASDRDSIDASVRLMHLRQLVQMVLDELESQKGPETATSLIYLVWQLCELWERETGRLVTSSPVSENRYTGEPQSLAGRFSVAVIEVLQPSDEWVKQHRSDHAPVRARTKLCRRSYVRQTHFAMRAYVRLRPRNGTRPAGGEVV